MPRSYRHIKEYEKEILELRECGISNKEICERFDLSLKQLKNFITRYNRKQREPATDVVMKKRGRPPQDCNANETDDVDKLKYIITRKDARIKYLEMENELMRDFLSLIERK